MQRLFQARSGPVAWLIYAGVRCLVAFMQLFPIEWNLRSARILARIWPFVMERHRNRAIDHLQLAYGDTLSRVELNRLADQSLQSVAMFAVEAFCLPRLITQSTWNRYIRLQGFEEALEAMLSGEGAIMLTGHYGSFEVMGHLLAAVGYDMWAIMRPLDNVYLNRFLVHSRRTRGLKLIDKKGASGQAERLLSEGNLLCFIGDQDAGRKGVFVDFFGQPASTYKSIGLLAMSARCPIIVGYARRKGHRAFCEVGVQRVIRPSQWEGRDDPLRWITQEYTAAIEQTVRDDPSQYLWIHRRWKSRPRSKAVG